MALIWHFKWLPMLAADIAAWWRYVRLPTKLAVGASVLVLGGMIQLGMIVAGHIRESVLQQSASAAALYMDSFVAGRVQELATKSTLSNEDRLALEKLLSPASMHRPLIAFRIWKGDTVAFSNERDFIGQSFARTAARERAWQGQIAVEFEQPDGDDDEQIRSLNLPVLEVYAPVRQTGTNRIIALVETYEIGIEVKNEVWRGQLSAWIAIVAVALTVIVLLFAMASTGAIERNSLIGRIGQLSLLRAESDRHRLRVSRASMRMCATNERSLRNVGNDLSEGPGQHLASALLRFEALAEMIDKADAAMPLHSQAHREDLEAIRKALNDTLRHVRGVAGSFSVTDMEHLTPEEVFAKAAARHERQTGANVEFRSHGLPQQLAFPLKASLYRFTLESLDSTYPAQAQRLSVSCDNETMMLEIVGGRGTSKPEPDLAARNCPRLGALRDRIEAVGGKLKWAATPDGGMSLMAELSLSDMEMADG
jgi:signal transduction histidine kinase